MAADPLARRMAGLGLGAVALGCGGVLGVLLAQAGTAARFLWLFTPRSPAQAEVIYLACCTALGVAGAALLLSRLPVPSGRRPLVLVACIFVAAVAILVAPVALVIWAIPIWLVFRWATARA